MPISSPTASRWRSIIEGNPDDAIHDLDDIPEIAAEQILVLQYYTFSKYLENRNRQVGFIDPTQIYNVDPRNNLFACDGIQPSGPTLSDPSFNVVAINGQLIPTFELGPGRGPALAVRGCRLGRPAVSFLVPGGRSHTRAEISMYEIALDGLATGALAQVSPMVIAPGQRSDLLVKVPLLPSRARGCIT